MQGVLLRGGFARAGDAFTLRITRLIYEAGHKKKQITGL
jgi:hypothetical protein